jgi:hypothetical protein
MKKWTELEQQEQTKRAYEPFDNDECEHECEHEHEYEAGGGGILEDWIPLATSVRRDASATDAANDPHASAVVAHPLTIELKCRRCETSGPEAGARAFLMGPQPLSIVLCHNRIDSDRAEVEEILTHELVHLYDVQTLQLDLSDCETVAYSEVRAAREAECDRSVRDVAAAAAANSAASAASGSFRAVTTQISETLQNRVYKPYCVRNIALGATQNMFPREGKACLNKVWETAYGDHRPFARQHEGAQTTQQSQEQHNYADNNANNGRIQDSNNHKHNKWDASHESNSGTSHGTSDK